MGWLDKEILVVLAEGLQLPGPFSALYCKLKAEHPLYI